MKKYHIGLSVGVLFLLTFGILYAGGLGGVYAQKHEDVGHEKHIQVCTHGKAGDEFDCHARVIVDEKGTPKASSLPSGLGPIELHSAYTSQKMVSGQMIIAIVDAYDHPYILNDLNTYSDTFGIPRLPACVGPIASSATPCFEKINQNGGHTYPGVNAGWALEIALDVETAHAMCQNCSILLVEASSNSYANLMTAVDRAILSGADVVSNSYGSGEFSGETFYDSHFNKPGVAITFSSGDSGYGAGYPAASQYVTAVGGTTLFLNPDKTYAGETAWSGSGSGCSAYESKPTWQTDTGCAKRTIADVSAVADPNTGAAVYDSVRYYGRRGWFKVGGTSLSAPVVAGTYALAGAVPSGVMGNSLPYASASGTLHDVISGSNGSCGGSYLCVAVSGYDGPTGLGTPSGTGAF